MYVIPSVGIDRLGGPIRRNKSVLNLKTSVTIVSCSVRPLSLYRHMGCKRVLLNYWTRVSCCIIPVCICLLSIKLGLMFAKSRTKPIRWEIQELGLALWERSLLVGREGVLLRGWLKVHLQQMFGCTLVLPNQRSWSPGARSKTVFSLDSNAIWYLYYQLFSTLFGKYA